jgi:hypothetical protein
VHRCLTILLLLLAIVPRAFAEPPPDKPRQYQQALARECDALINSAVKRPYGWAWGDTDEAEPSKPGAPRRNGIPVSIEPATSPAAGIILLEAAALLGEPKYADAARHVGRGVAATQQGRGSFPPTALFGASSPAALPVASPLPDRAPTRAGLALLLSLVEADPQAQDAVSRAAPRAAQWLLRQQGDSGAWPVLYPPGAAPKDSTRIVRLDTPDTRDSILAMLLAYEVLGDAALRRSAERSLEFLNKPHVNATTEVGVGLWQSAYTPSALTVEKMAEFPPGFDALASRYCVQTFFATWVTLGEATRLSTCETASKSLDELFKQTDGQWHRRFDLKGRVAATPGAPATTEPADAASDPELPPLRQAIADARHTGRDQWRERLGGEPGVKRQLAWTLVGLSDSPMLLDLPTQPAEVNDYLKRHAERLRLLQGGGDPPQLRDKIRQLWALYLRARIEKEFGM